MDTRADRPPPVTRAIPKYTIAHGIALESDLPYKARDEPCDESVPKAVTAAAYVKLAENSASALERTIATVGPVAVNVAANWKTYGGGVFSGGCDASGCTLNHVVVAEGYSQPGASDAEGWWTIRNSWGAGWGERCVRRRSEAFACWRRLATPTPRATSPATPRLAPSIGTAPQPSQRSCADGRARRGTPSPLCSGYIRLSRKFDNATFVDQRPSAGVACEPFPRTQVVGGESGVLFDMSYPTGMADA